MKAEKYLLDYIVSHNIPIAQIENDIGINIENRVNEKQDLMASEFLTLCTYLGITPEEVSDQILKKR